MAKPTSLDALSDEIEKILQDYEDDLDDKIGEVMGKVARKGAQLLQSTSPIADNTPLRGAYAKGWKVSVENHRNLTHEAVIYNKYPWLPHLLEYGHPTHNGGRADAQPHIKKVEERLLSDFNVEELLP